MQAQALDDLYVGNFGEGEEAVDVRLRREILCIAVGAVAADAEVFDAEGLEEINERLIIGTKIADAISIWQQER